MLEVKALVGPAAHARGGLHSSGRGLTRDEPRHDEAIAHVGRGVQVAPFDGLAQVVPRASGQLCEAPQVEQAHEQEHLRAVELPGRAGATLEEDRPRALEPRDACPERILELQRPGMLAEEDCVPHQLVDEERVAAGLARDLLGADGAGGRHATEQVGGERDRVRFVEVAEGHLAHFALELADDVLPALAQCRQEEQRRRVGRTEQRPQERQAVRIGPLQVVDHRDDGPPVRESHEQLAQGEEHVATQLLGIERLEEPGRPGDGLDPPQHGKHLREQGSVARQERRRVGLGQSPERPAERVHDAVDRLVGHGLVLVASPGEHDGRRIPRDRPFDERAHEGRLADPGLAA